MAIIKEESEDFRIEEVFSLKDTEEQTGWFHSQSLTCSFENVQLCVTVVIPNVASTHPSQTLNGRRTQYSGCLFFLLFSAAILIVSEEYIKMYF